MDLKKYIIDVDNFPIPNKTFHDLTPIMQNGEAFNYAINKIVEFSNKLRPDIIVGPEAQGFILGCPLAYALSKGFVPVRKPKKLPRKTKDITYELDYGVDTLCIHEDAIQPGQRVIIVDDVLATGGTVEATIELVEKLKGIVVGSVFLLELSSLKGKERVQTNHNNLPIEVLMSMYI